jgi:hypothetical protein
MYKSPLEEFLDSSTLKTNPNYVSTLFKTAYSKNITIEEWNTFINQFVNLISQDESTYLGFTKVLDEIRLFQPGSSFVNAVGIPYAENNFRVDSDKLHSDTLYGSVEYLHTHKLNQNSSITDLIRAYVKNPNGSQSMLDVSEGAVADSIMYRDRYGRSCVAMPGDNPLHIANKDYVDNVFINETELDALLEEVFT